MTKHPPRLPVGNRTPRAAIVLSNNALGLEVASLSMTIDVAEAGHHTAI